MSVIYELTCTDADDRSITTMLVSAVGHHEMICTLKSKGFSPTLNAKDTHGRLWSARQAPILSIDKVQLPEMESEQ